MPDRHHEPEPYHNQGPSVQHLVSYAPIERKDTARDVQLKYLLRQYTVTEREGDLDTLKRKIRVKKYDRDSYFGIGEGTYNS
jgi:hypothetical protein